MTKRTLSLLAGLLLTLPAHAAEEPGVVLESTIQKEVVEIDADGEEVTRLTDVGTALPGDTIVFTIRFRNEGSEPAENIVLTNRVDPALTYVSGSAMGAGYDIEYSVDGGRTFGPLADLTVTGPDGESRPAGPEDVTTIRWRPRNPLPPGGEGFVRFKATVD